MGESNAVEITVDHVATKTSIKSKTLPGWYPPILFAGLAIIFYLVIVSFNSLPAQLQINDEALNPGRFIGQRAQHITKRLADIGPKIASSVVNQVVAVNIILDEIEKISQTAAPAHLIETDIQTGNGNLSVGALNQVYKNYKNVVVRLSPVGREPPFSLLLNTHFDSVPVSPGAGDAATMVSVMLEILRVLTRENITNEHAIVFLFNGAEENGLKGSHLFITEHKWAADLRAYINLDSAGSGGQEMLFQIAPNNSWLVDYYRKTSVHPFATVMAQEMYQANLIPSDTDFRIFRDYGHLVGMDFATGLNAYVYHTKFDTFDNIPSETFQNIGDNILALTKALANAPELRDLNSYAGGDVVYFDFVGWFFITYTTSEAKIINFSVCAVIAVGILLSLRSFAKSSGVSNCYIAIQYLVIFLVEVISVGLGIGAVIVLSVVYDASHKSMSWFSHPWLILGIYISPMVCLFSLGPAVYLTVYKKRVAKSQKVSDEVPSVKRSHQVQMFLHAHALILVVVLILLTSVNILTGFVVVIALIFYAISLLLNLFTSLQLRDRSWVLTHLAGQLLPFLFYAYTCILLACNFLPVQGRSGPNSNPETMIAYLCIAFGTLLTGFIVPTFMLYKQPLRIVFASAVLFLVGIIVMLTPVGFPYRPGTSFQRQWIYHTERTFYKFDNKTFEGTVRKSDSGFFMLAMDRHNLGYLDGAVPNISQAVDVGTWCGTELFCGVPFFHPRMLAQVPGSHWLPAGKPFFAQPAVLNLNQTERLHSNVKRFHFQLTGPDQMVLYLSAVQTANVVGWSFSDLLRPTAHQLAGRQTYFVLLAYSEVEPYFEFTIDVQYGAADWTEYSLDIAIIGHYMHHDETQTSEFKAFLNSFPDYEHVTPWMSTYKSYQC